MSDFDANKEAAENDRDRLKSRLHEMESDPSVTLAEWRVVQRELEHAENKLIWFDCPLSRLRYRD